jgi:hypothetical protein
MLHYKKSGRRAVCRGSLFIGLLACYGCGGTDGGAVPTPQDSLLPAPTVIDSALPVDEEIRRFRATIADTSPRAQLTNAARSRDDLVRRFIQAIAQHDTATLRSFVIDRAEFIDIYYPSSIYARPPYKQSPGFVWFQFEQNSVKGLTRLLLRYGGARLGFQSYNCSEQPTVQRNNQLWQECRVTWAQQPPTLRLFGTILEHDGRFKFVSYANDL